MGTFKNSKMSLSPRRNSKFCKLYLTNIGNTLIKVIIHKFHALVLRDCILTIQHCMQFNYPQKVN